MNQAINLAKLTEQELQVIEEQKIAAQLIHQYQVGQITRRMILKAINQRTGERQANFRKYLNHYKALS